MLISVVSGKSKFSWYFINVVLALAYFLIEYEGLHHFTHTFVTAWFACKALKQITHQHQV